MAGMRALGRVYDITTNASGVALSLKNCSGIGLLAIAGSTATGTLTLTASSSYGGTYTAVNTTNGFGQPTTWFQRAGDSTHAWTKQTASWSSNALTIAATSGYQSYVDYLVSELADTYDYLKITAGTAITLTAILYDMTVQRTPENLVIPSS